MANDKVAPIPDLPALAHEIMQLFGGMEACKAGAVKKYRPAILQLWNGGFRAIDRVRTRVARPRVVAAAFAHRRVVRLRLGAT